MDARTHLRAVMGRVIERLAARIPSDDFIDVPDGIMVAFYPKPAIAKRIAIEGGESPDDLHITLALPGKLSSLTSEQRRRLPVIVRGFAMISRPLTGTIAGLTEFPVNEGKKPIVYLIDVPGLAAWRQRLVEILVLNGYTVASDHGFVPHMTVKYAAPDETLKATDAKITFDFDSVCLMLGGERREYALGGNPDVDESIDAFAARAPGRPRREVAAVDAYQAALMREYEAWADDCAEQLADEPDDDKRRALLLLLLLLLLRRLTKLGQDHLPEAVALGGASSAPIFAKLAELLGENAATLKDSLIPAIQAKIEAALADADVALALKAGQGAAAIKAVLATVAARVGSYAGQWWKAYNQSIGIKSVEDGVGLMAHLDPRVTHHCGECPQFQAEGGKPYASFGEYLDTTGGRTPGEFECQSGCRCWLSFGEPQPNI